MQTLSISDIQRNLHKLDNIDIVQIVDKKRNKTKGYFLSEKYYGMVEDVLDRKRNKGKQQADRLKKLSANPVKIDPNIDLIKMPEAMYRDIF